MGAIRSPATPPARRHGGAVAIAGVPGAWRQARRGGRRQPRRRLEGRVARGSRRQCRSLHGGPRGGDARTCRRAGQRHSRLARPLLAAARLCRRRDCGGRWPRRRGSRRVCRSGARRRRAGQRHRSAGIQRFFLRRHCQSLTACRRHLDRRRRAGLRPSDPRQDRSRNSPIVRALGRGCAPMAAARAGAGAAVPKPAQFLGKVHRRSPSRRRTLCRPRPSSMRCSNRRPSANPARWCWSAPDPATRNC